MTYVPFQERVAFVVSKYVVGIALLLFALVVVWATVRSYNEWKVANPEEYKCAQLGGDFGYRRNQMICELDNGRIVELE